MTQENLPSQEQPLYPEAVEAAQKFFAHLQDFFETNVQTGARNAIAQKNLETDAEKEKMHLDFFNTHLDVFIKTSISILSLRVRPLTEYVEERVLTAMKNQFAYTRTLQLAKANEIQNITTDKTNVHQILPDVKVVNVATIPGVSKMLKKRAGMKKGVQKI